jgi:hypothetical protein
MFKREMFFQPFIQPATTAGPGTGSYNPCSMQSIALGQLYFAYPGDNTKFIECDLQGNPSVLTCPTVSTANTLLKIHTSK